MGHIDPSSDNFVQRVTELAVLQNRVQLARRALLAEAEVERLRGLLEDHSTGALLLDLRDVRIDRDRYKAALAGQAPPENILLPVAHPVIVRMTELIKRAAPFVNAVCVIADDKGPSLAWLHDAGLEVGSLDEREVEGHE